MAAALLSIFWLAGCQASATAELATPTRRASDPAPTAAATNTAPPAASPTARASATSTPSATATASPVPTASATEAATATATPTQPAPSATTVAQTIYNTPSVWNTSLVGGDVMTGNCGAAVNPPYGLVLITPGAETLVWHNTVPEDYAFQKTGDTTYLYTGPTGIGDGTVTMQLTLIGAEALQMTRAFVSNAEPDCTHTHTYSGVFQYFRP